MKRYLLLLAVAAVMVVTSFAGGVSAASLITGAQIKNGSVTGTDVRNGRLTGADVRSSSIPSGDLQVRPHLYRWTGHYTSDGTSLTGTATSRLSVPANSLLRSVALTYSGDVSSCVRHGNLSDPSINTGRIEATVDAGGSGIASYHSAAKLTSTVGSPAHANVGTELFTGATARRIGVSETCMDTTHQTTDTSPMPSFTLALTFEVTPMTMTGAATFP